MSLLTMTRRTARRVGASTTLEILARIGLAGYGVLHLVVAWLAARIALGEPAAEGDQSGAFRVLAVQPMGRVLVVALAVGLVAMAVWQLFEALVGHEDERAGRRGLERALSVARAVVYVGLAVTAFQVVRGAPTSNAHQQAQATGGVLAWAGGVFLVGTAGVVVVVVGLVMAGYGVTAGFERHLRRAQMSRRARRAAVLTGRIGYAAKGVAYAIVGVLLVVAALRYQPDRSTGLDGALRALAAQPYGEALLLIVAAGLAMFGGYGFFQARYRKV